MSTATETSTTPTTTTSTTTTTWTNDSLREAIMGLTTSTPRLPLFWTINPEAWFIQAEAHFALSKITSDNTKYTNVVASLPPEIISKSVDIIQKVASESTGKYEALKTALLARIGLTEEQRISNLLYHEQMGDQTPSEFYRRLQRLVGNSENELKFLMKIFTDRLPAPLDSTVIQLKSQGPTIFLPVIDSIWEKIKSQKPSVSAVESNANSDKLTKTLESIEKRLARLEEQKQGKEKSRSRSRSRSNMRSDSSKNLRNRSKTPKDSVCYFHKTFGKEARKCAKGCTFSEPTDQKKPGN